MPICLDDRSLIYESHYKEKMEMSCMDEVENIGSKLLFIYDGMLLVMQAGLSHSPGGSQKELITIQLS